MSYYGPYSNLDQQKFKDLASEMLGNYTWRDEIIDREFATCSTEVFDFIDSLQYNLLQCDLVPVGMLFCMSKKIYQQCPSQNQNELCKATRKRFELNEQLMMKLPFMEKRRKQ